QRPKPRRWQFRGRPEAELTLAASAAAGGEAPPPIAAAPRDECLLALLRRALPGLPADRGHRAVRRWRPVVRGFPPERQAPATSPPVCLRPCVCARWKEAGTGYPRRKGRDRRRKCDAGPENGLPFVLR